MTIKISYFIMVFVVAGLGAEESKGALYSQISKFERETVDEGLTLYGLVPEENPSGLVTKIHFYTKSPFSKEAGFLSFLDRIHINTKDEIINQYLFQKEGEIYDKAAVRDSEQSLRRQGLVRSLAVVVPVKSKDPSVKGLELLVATRDLLTLRPTFSFEGNAEVLTDLMVAVGEHSLFGTNKSVATIYEMKQAMHILSGRYFDPQLFGSRLELNVKPGFIFSRDHFEYDGFIGEFGLERPLISENDKWGYGLNLEYGSKPIIDFNGGQIRTFDVPSTKIQENIERRYRWRYGKGRIQGRRSFGTIYKKEIFSSYGLNIKRPALSEDLNLNEIEKEAFQQDVLPKNELESFVTFGFSYFHNEFMTLYDYNNFKLAETKRSGPSLTLSADFSSKEILVSDHSFIRPESKLTYLLPFNYDAFGMASISTSNRYDGEFSDNTYKFGLTLVSPKILKIARLVFDGRLSTTLDNRDNQNFSLGADSGIRGVKSGFYRGSKAFRTNLELRSAPLDLWILHLGLVLFYDVGTAAKEWSDANATHTLGLGLRVLTPQISSQLFRIDIGFPIFGRGRDEHIVVPSFGTGQAF
jgi:hypothetical protein